MLRFMIRMSSMFAVLLSASFALGQSDFSADLVDTSKPDATAKAKMYFTKDKARFEPIGNGAKGAFIMNLSTHMSTVVMAQQHMYMEMPMQASAQRSGYSFFRTGDAEAACGDWVQTSSGNGSTCRKVGSDTVNGRSAVKYEATSANGDTNTFWIDPKLHFAVKWQNKGGSGELRNIQEGTQPASLFEVPAGFNKMDMGGMMQQR